MGQPILRGILKDGLHLEEVTVKSTGSVRTTTACEFKKVVNVNKEDPLTLTLSNISISSVVSKTTWHRQLGHPSPRIFNLVTKGCNLSFKRDTTKIFHSCELGKSHSTPFSLSESRT